MKKYKVKEKKPVEKKSKKIKRYSIKSLLEDFENINFYNEDLSELYGRNINDFKFHKLN